MSDYSGMRDEGMRNWAFNLGAELSRRHTLLHLKVWDAMRPGFWQGIRRFHPDVVHFIPGPTIKSFLMVRLLKLSCPWSVTVMSATHPALSRLSARLVPLLRPDLILTQTNASQAMFSRLGIKTRHLPGGVDSGRFIPASAERKQGLRTLLGVDRDVFVVLHLGPVKQGRNVLLLSKVKGPGIQPLLVGNLSVPMERRVHQQLVDAGCLVWRKYFPNAEDLYALADCYLFPTEDRLNCIEMPLSVLEAMSCNLPVVSTRYGALPEVFPAGQGLFYYDEPDAVSGILQELRSGAGDVRTRGKVLPLSWEKVASKLEAYYQEVL